MVAMKQQLQKEYDARTANETKYIAANKQLKIARQDNQEQQVEILSLMKKLEEVHCEQAYLKELRGVDSDVSDSQEDEREPNDDKAEDKPESKTDEEKQDAKDRKRVELELEFEERVASDASEAASHYFNLLQCVRQEFRALYKQHQKLAGEVKKDEALTAQLYELEQERKELQDKVNKQSRGTQLVICMQNFVRKMLQEKLEASAKQIEEAAEHSK